jgi:uncharacterized protein YecT (DUF1311 family)
MKTTLLKHLVALGLASHCALALSTATGPKPTPVDCSKTPGTQSELNACAFQDFEAATAAYSAAYKTLSQSVGNQQRKLLRQVQTEWIQHRRVAAVSGLPGRRLELRAAAQVKLQYASVSTSRLAWSL